MKHRWNVKGRAPHIAAPADDQSADPWREPMAEWTMSDIQKAARMAASRVHGGNALGSDRLDTAWEGVALHVCEYPNASWSDAVDAGARLIGRDADRLLKDRSDEHAGPRFAAMWITPRATYADPMDQVVDHIAHHQVWVRLDGQHQHTILTRAAALSDTRAGEVLGLTPGGFSYRMQAARRKYLRCLYDWEPAPVVRHIKPYRRDATHCVQGHEWAGNEQYVTTRGTRHRRCAECNRQAARNTREKAKATP